LSTKTFVVLIQFLNAIEQLADAKKEIDAKCAQPIGWADLIALAPAGKARYSFLKDFCGYTDRFEPRWQVRTWNIMHPSDTNYFWHFGFFGISLAFGTASTPKPFVSSSSAAPQYKAGDITKVGCDIDTMLQAPFGSSPEQIEATSWYRQNYASTGPLTGSRVHMGRADATGPDASGLVPPEGSSAGEYIQWFGRMRLSIPALVNLSPYGKFILMRVWAIGLTSCFVYS
jgi:L-ascorbate peroxidase